MVNKSSFGYWQPENWFRKNGDKEIRSEDSWQISRSGWAEFFQDLSLFKEAALLTSHPAAALVTSGLFPRFELPPDRVWAFSRNRHLSLDFSSWNQVLAVRNSGKSGKRYSVEVFNSHGANTHSLWLPVQADAADLHKLFAFYESSAGNETSSLATSTKAPWQSKLNGRLKWLRAGVGIDLQKFPIAALHHVFLAVQERNIEVLAGVFNDSAIQRQPLRFREVGWTNDGLWVRDAGALLRLSLQDLFEIWCVGGACGCCGKSRWTLEGYDRKGHLAFTLQVAQDGSEPVWRSLVKQAIEAPQPTANKWQG